ncbi:MULTISPECIES: aminotransferase class V-fold PLP-dependent enzyme [Arenibacter]|uniref:aminotransferase class V-fold PLP-dependent enzyme n=1 Tax=Arenibacter TaxID=178469 RepID=UPI001C06C7D5|nr:MULTISPECIES: aminotransferase class V-fold PLP-dependent enzyme [Arenibacter]MBU2906785.1 aminotransferase class V-fold PLP-dependent enzyme [Arenibacter algicola]MCK0133286.1 aminotransferase class V-fold PLP-dependent enzyme [Arenibacter sp. S6351L]
MLSRRKLLKTLSSVPVVGGLVGTGLLAPQLLSAAVTKPATRNFFKELGLRTFINAAGTYTSMTGSLMSEEVTSAIVFGATEYVDLDELQDKVGERIAELLECEYATVSSGAFGAMSIGLAGVISGMDSDIAAQLPDTTGLKNEVIIQEGHNIGYTHALLNVGAKLVVVKTKKEMEKAINKNTAMLWFLNANTDNGEVKYDEFIALGKKHKIPTFIDCAADVPPVENLFKFTKMGFDLVAFSGGKGIRGPQSAGLLLGKRDLIKAARIHTPPRGSTIGRGMKVNKEEVLGMLVALEMYLAKDHEKEWELWENQIKLISDSALSVKGVQTEIHVPPYANHVPSLRIKWDSNLVKISPEEARKKLMEGHPAIATVGDKETIGITTWMMDPGQERIVAKRLKEVLENV